MLSKKLAQKIVEKVMESIPYNINIMDESGVIIGSGEESRIGNFHNGALETIKTGKDVEIFEDTAEEKRGVNIPIIFRNKVVGVIGITGAPHIVKPFAKLVSVTAELLVNQEYTINENVIEQKLIEEFLYQWINMKDDYDENFIQKGLSLGIDVTKAKQVAAIQLERIYYKNAKEIIKKFIKQDEYILQIVSDKIIVILNFDEDIDKRIKLLNDKLKIFSAVIGLGESNCEKLSVSLKQSVSALEIGNNLYSDRSIYKYKKLKFFDEINNIEREICQDIILNILDKGGEELFKTFLKYIEFNGERLKIADNLNIHRNTLNYRIERIQEITGLNMNEYKDLVRFITAYIYYKLNN